MAGRPEAEPSIPEPDAVVWSSRGDLTVRQAAALALPLVLEWRLWVYRRGEGGGAQGAGRHRRRRRRPGGPLAVGAAGVRRAGQRPLAAGPHLRGGARLRRPPAGLQGLLGAGPGPDPPEEVAGAGWWRGRHVPVRG